MDSWESNYRRKSSSSIPLIIVVALISALIGGAVMALWFHSQYGAMIEQAAKYEPTGYVPIQVEGQGSIVTVVDNISPAVVGITNKAITYDWFNRPRVVERGSGSGVIFHEEGYIATNHHVVEGARELVVTMKDGTSYAGRIVGMDAMSDLAVVKIEGDEPFPAATFGNSGEVKVGEAAIAIGNPLGFEHTVTVGVISAINRSLQVGERELVFLQTDAAINAGNSGGPLVNIRGQVIGINTAKIPGAGIEGLGFAIPISLAQPILDNLIVSGRVAYPWMGVMLVDKGMIEEYNMTDIEINRGVYVMEVVDGSPADRADIRMGDVIISIANAPIDSVEELQTEIRKKQVGETITVMVLRNDREVTVNVTLGEAPAD
jgi:serine protease Do